MRCCRVWSVLVEGDDHQEPIADTVRGLLDGHTWLSRELAGRGHYPAIDILASISRLMNDLTERPQHEAATCFRELLGAYRDHQDLISIGAYRKGANRTVDVAIEMREEIDRFLRQPIDERVTSDEARVAMHKLYEKAKTKLGQTAPTAPAATTTNRP